MNAGVRPNLAPAATAALAVALISLRLPEIPPTPVPAPGIACKGIETPRQARGCGALEFDLSPTKDERWVVLHGPRHKGRPIAELTRAEIGPDALEFPELVAGLDGKYGAVNLDLKEDGLWPGRGRLTRAFERYRPELERLAARSEVLIVSSPVPARYAELHRWLARSAFGPKLQPASELLDYRADEAARWGMPLLWWQRLGLIPARIATVLHRAINSGRIHWVIMQERTAQGLATNRLGSAYVLCWTREPKGEPPSACVWTQRHRKG